MCISVNARTPSNIYAKKFTFFAIILHTNFVPKKLGLQPSTCTWVYEIIIYVPVSQQQRKISWFIISFILPIQPLHIYNSVLICPDTFFIYSFHICLNLFIYVIFCSDLYIYLSIYLGLFLSIPLSLPPSLSLSLSLSIYLSIYLFYIYVLLY